MSVRDTGRLAAITGIGCRLPGSINDPVALWDALLAGEAVTRPIPERRWSEMVQRLHPGQRPDRPWTAGVIDDLDDFDAAYFAIAELEAAQMDPQQRMILEVVTEALADAGIAAGSLAGTRTGVWAGSASVDHTGTVFLPGRHIEMGSVSGTSPSILSNRVSYLLGLRGPSMTVDTACSASATALHLARQSLESGEVDTAIVIGTNTMTAPGITAAFASAGVLAPDGVCRPFDPEGQGYVRSEAVVVTVLRRTGDAQDAHDRIYAVLRGSATNSDGHSPAGLYAPNPPAHVDLLRDAYAAAGVAPEHVDYVQCHGTGTKAGDSSEGRALARVLGADRDTPLPIGSVKSVLGHSEGASGLVGAVCTALALHYGRIPPTAAHTELRPTLSRLPLRVPVKTETWPDTGRPRLAGVSSFGFGGSNVHVVLEQAPVPAARDEAVPGRTRLVPVSAPTAERLRLRAEAWSPVVAATDLAGTAATAQHRRDHQAVRAAVVADGTADASAALAALATGRSHPALVGPARVPTHKGPLVWLFCGHGSQHARMAVSAYATEPVFRAAFDDASQALRAHLGRAVWSPGTKIDGFETAQHAIWLTQTAQAALWRSWGYTPDAVLGHSLGEVAAAHAAGALGLDDAARVVAVRSALLARTSGQGGLLVTELPPAQAEAAIAGRSLVVAAYNAPDTTVISGPVDPLRKLAEELERDGVYVRRVAEDVPAHSPAVDDLVPQLADALADVVPREGEPTFYSSVTAEAVAGDRLGADYWARQLRAPVRFTDALAAAVEGEGAVVVELGGRSTLARGASATLATGTSTATIVAAGDTERDDHAALMTQFGMLYTTGHTPVQWPQPFAAPVRLPVTWDRGRHHDSVSIPGLDDVLAEDNPDQEAVITALTRLVAQVLGAEPDQIDPERSLIELGLTSVAVIGLRDAIRAAHPGLAGFGVGALLDPGTSLASVAKLVSEYSSTVAVSG
ncbi:type I polyketide synthase [Nocardiopsis ansamitocini]|uniref:Uncharacterized protein n=1 Tax=Nocardiopsis ansamitocini TaxID=1670832 RepID=A0A9W6UGC2_9ACTN|nr:beta-ketoacyl synthase N-terminal-like domain-containing protein [Nocardiopsis ansamitocini]GLU47176.1 hypothetical protein Nans01_15270 [Nocardiopsis ansamitocini]